MTQSKCPKCGGSGLLPFTGKDGKVRKDVHLFCDCHPIYGENAYIGCYSVGRPDDIDYPCSDTFRGYSFEYCGMPDQGYISPDRQEEAPKPQEIIHRHSNMSSKDFAKLRSMEGQVKFLQDKVDELTKRRQPKQKPAGYKGLK